MEQTLRTKKIILIALITAVTCILAPLSIPIPISPVPISLTNLVLLISVYLLDVKSATISYLAYLLLGLVGLPIFSGFSGGAHKLAGPTGGYLIGFIPFVIICGLSVKYLKNRALIFCAFMLATIVAYAFGTLWLAQSLEIGFIEGLAIGVFPYIIGDVTKCILALMLGPVLAKRLGAYKITLPASS
ncbi:biotin transport system substrate-specific component [Lachnospiraceae bacterium PF1-21]|uniref:Biotin transporter n=1 Tax=Ohessyouella blattaphilus TaxID=2949333 RepID=A0ABT1EH83_9FIRM|nr:biotin transporter BioY [Ohessyouella blattaphilus]MCP1110048.1 biotin transporter BioY [Ohessyouella blattaphilus]MCR8563442.1 biotin transporter BioY [Ohessyouella blattaphilus]MDL2249184.1 biotin transporter BioY [Lachnospiraceae bacterium OttesenSCG-928-J05]